MTAFNPITTLSDRLRLYRFIPRSLRGTDTFAEQRAKLLVLTSVGTTVVAVAFALIHWFNGAEWLAMSLLGGALLVSSVPRLVRRAFHLTWVANWFAFLCYVTLCSVVVFAGGMSPEALAWMYLPPVVGHVFAGRRSGTVWLLISLATCAATYLLAQYVTFPDHVDENHPSVAVGSAVGLIMVNSLLFLVYSYQQRWLQDSLASAQHEALEASQESFHTLVEHSPDALLVMRYGEAIYVNPAFEKMLGYELEDLEDINWAEVVPDNELDRVVELNDELLDRPGRVDVHEGTRIRKDGAEIEVEARTFSTTFRGEPALIVTMRDITERKQMQAKMMHMDRMVAVGTLAAGVAHEINNPLAFISGNATLLLTEHEDGSFDNWQPPARRALDHAELGEMLADIVDGAERIRRIVSGLRSFAREQQDDAETTAVDLVGLLESVLKMANHEIKHRARLVTDFQEVPTVVGDNAELGQVFLNLVVNAAHAIPPGSRDSHEICVRTELRDSMVHVSVSDTGAGIPDEIKARIFDPFFSTKSEQEGMGLGLYITQSLVQKHGGELTFESTPGRGTTFRVCLPTSSKKPSDISGPLPAASQPPLGARVMVIDDEPRMLRTLTRALDGFEVTALDSAAAALERIRKSADFDAILCDFSMPQTSGVQFFRRLEQEYGELSKRVIFMTGGTVSEEARAFVESSNRPVVSKPFDIPKLRHLLREEMSNSDVAARTR